MLNMYRWQREQSVASELQERRNRHAYVMDKEEAAEEPGLRTRLTETLRALAFHLAPNIHWNREVAGESAT